MNTPKPQVSLVPMTRELWHDFYKNYIHDPDIFADNFHEYFYEENRVNTAFNEQVNDVTRIVFALCLENNPIPIGQLKLKHIDMKLKECSLGISLVNDSIKNKGYGTEGEKLALQYAFQELGMVAVKADAILKNKRSQHVLEKVGFEYVSEDDMFKYYRCDRNRFTQITIDRGEQ